MNQKELAAKAREMQRDYKNSEIAELLHVRLEDLTSAITLQDPAVRVYTVEEIEKVKPVKVVKTKAKRKKKL